MKNEHLAFITICGLFLCVPFLLEIIAFQFNKIEPTWLTIILATIGLPIVIIFGYKTINSIDKLDNISSKELKKE